LTDGGDTAFGCFAILEPEIFLNQRLQYAPLLFRPKPAFAFAFMHDQPLSDEARCIAANHIELALRLLQWRKQETAKLVE
jgi:hypothetical protein